MGRKNCMKLMTIDLISGVDEEMKSEMAGNLAEDTIRTRMSYSRR
jgi:hypothetical protein